ncbi:MAG: DUF6754 domain-containing protein [Chloroflexota bacterium]
METFAQMIAENVDTAALAVLVVFFPFFVLFSLRAAHGYRFEPRPIPLLARMRQLASQAAESGQALHVSVGAGEVGTRATPEALMGLTVLGLMARHAAAYGQGVSAAVGQASMLPLAQGLLRRAEAEAGHPARRGASHAVFYGPDRLAYAAGAVENIAARSHLANIAIGPLAAEGLWLTEAAAAPDLKQIGGTSDPAGAALLHASLGEALVGEEVFAAGAYLGLPAHLGSLAAQDLLRVIVLLSIVAGVVLASLGYWG